MLVRIKILMIIYEIYIYIYMKYMTINFEVLEDIKNWLYKVR